MNFLRNIAVNLRATGPAAVLIAWLACVFFLGLFGSGPLADRAMNILAISGGLILVILAQKT